MSRSPVLFGLSSLALGLLLAGFVFADWIAPYGPQEETRSHAYHPPVTIHFRDGSAQWFPRPFVYRTEAHFDASHKRIYIEDSRVKYFIQFGPRKFLCVEPPARIYLLGTDSRGRDFYSRILYGGRLSVVLALLGAGLAAVIGLLVGGAAGYFGGRIDDILMRGAEFFIMVPGFYFLLALRSTLPPTLGSRQVYALVVVVLSLIGWGGISRVIRGMVLSIRESDFVAAARVLGRSHLAIIVEHIVPHTSPYLVAILSVSIPGYMMAESALSVLGLGIQEPDVSLGNLLTEGLRVAHWELYPWVVWPGVVLVMIAFSLNVIGDYFKTENGY